MVYKNAFCVVAGDGSRMGSAEESVRRLIAIEAVSHAVADTPRHQKEIEEERDNSEIGFNASVKSLFNTVWYPQTNGLKSARIDLGHHQDKGVIRGEQAVEAALSGGGAKKLVDLDPDRMEGLIQRCEEQLFPDGQSRIRWSDIVERAASNPRWIWLPPKGLEEIKAAALADERWSEENGYVDKNPPAPQPTVKVTRIDSNEATGESTLDIAAIHAGRPRRSGSRRRRRGSRRRNPIGGRITRPRRRSSGSRPATRRPASCPSRVAGPARSTSPMSARTTPGRGA